MAKYVKCIDNSRNKDSLTIDKVYESFSFDPTHISLVNDCGDVCTYLRHRFQDVEDERIIFSSQQEFEDAVMKVVLERLGVLASEKVTPYGNTKAYIKLEDLK